MQQRNERKDTNKTMLLIIAALLIVNLFGGFTAVREWMITQWMIREVDYGYAVMTATPESWFGTAVPQPDASGLLIIEEPAVIVATGAPPTYEQSSVPVVPVTEPVEVEPVEATAVPTHVPLPGSMAEAAEQGYWSMPITPQQYEQCVADPHINPACQFYVKDGE